MSSMSLLSFHIQEQASYQVGPGLVTTSPGPKKSRVSPLDRNSTQLQMGPGPDIFQSSDTTPIAKWVESRSS